MHYLRGAISVFFFEWNRSLTLSRMSAWAVLVLFPPALVGIMQYQAREPIDDNVWGLILFGLIPMVICLLGLLLWATPLLHTELEGKTWIYLAVRPRGRISVLLGKYLTAVVLTGLAGLFSVSLCIPIVMPTEPVKLWGVLLLLTAISCASYGAMYSLFAVVFHKRAMVIAVAYTLIFEFMVSFIPAMINQLTVQYRLRSLLYDLMDWEASVPDDAKLFFGTQPVWQHLLFLAGFVLVAMAAAVATLKTREYVSSEDVAS